MSKKNAPRYTTEQQKKNVLKWIKALESGEYRQCRDRLTDGKGFCCLGVATDLFIRSKDNRRLANGKLELRWETAYDESVHSDITYALLPNGRTEEGMLTVDVREWLGTHKFGIVPQRYIDLNDDEGYSFKKIAKELRNDLKAAEGE